MIEQYQKLTQGCKTINQLNSVHIALEKEMTPVQFFTLLNEYRKESTKKNTHTEMWLTKLNRLYSCCGKLSPEGFNSRSLNDHYWLYSHSSFERQNKFLLICFTGSHQMMMLPTAVFLQLFDAQQIDILVIRYPVGDGFRSGLSGIANDFVSFIENFIRSLPVTDYKDIVTLGVSGGAVPALFASLIHGYSKSICVSINSPIDKRWHDALAIDIGDIAKHYLNIALTNFSITLVCGDSHRRDIKSAQLWSNILPINLITVQTSQHNVFLPLLLKRRLVNFLNKVMTRIDH